MNSSLTSSRYAGLIVSFGWKRMYQREEFLMRKLEPDKAKSFVVQCIQLKKGARGIDAPRIKFRGRSKSDNWIVKAKQVKFSGIITATLGDNKVYFSILLLIFIWNAFYFIRQIYPNARNQENKEYLELRVKESSRRQGFFIHFVTYHMPFFLFYSSSFQDRRDNIGLKNGKFLQPEKFLNGFTSEAFKLLRPTHPKTTTVLNFLKPPM